MLWITFYTILYDNQKSYGRGLLQELEIKLDFPNNFIWCQDINIPMKPMNCKIRTHFTIPNSKKV